LIARATIVAALSMSSISLVAQVAPATVKYRATLDNVKYVYGAAEPAARVKAGDVIETNTLDAFGNALQKPGDSLSLVKGDNPLTGPFYVESAEPGDTLAVKILALDVDTDQGVGTAGPGFGALNATNYTPMIGSAIPDRIWFYPIDRQCCDIQCVRFQVFSEDSVAPVLRLYWCRTGRWRGQKLDRSRGIWRQHGLA
jgi:Acetamidase/Formamidase family